MLRVPLSAISTNRRPNTQLSPGRKRAILTLHNAGHKNHEIATLECLPPSTISTTIAKATTRQTLDNKPRTGRACGYTQRDINKVLRYARMHPLWTYNELIRETGWESSPRTLRILLKSHGILNWRAKRRPYLTAQHARLRLAFAQAHLHTDWTSVV